MTNPTPDTRPSDHTLLSRRIADLKGYVEFEDALPDAQQVPIRRLNALICQFLSEFKAANIRRAQTAAA